MAKNINRITLQRTFFSLGLAASLIAMVFLLRSASQQERAALMGYSASRLLLVGVLLAAGFVFAWLTVIAWKNKSSGQMEAVLAGWLDDGRGFSLTFYSALGGLIFSASAIFLTPELAQLPLYYYFVRFLPLAGWLAFISLAALICLALWSSPKQILSLKALVLLLLILLSGAWLHAQLWGRKGVVRTLGAEDIFYVYLEGQRLLDGENPYARIVGRSMTENDKYATYLPVSYYLSAAMQKTGLVEFGQWLSVWQVLLLAAAVAIAALIFIIPARRDLLWLAIFGALFWFFNRWTIRVSRISDVDFLAMFFLILSLSLHSGPHKRLAAYLLLGLSISIKQFGLFLVPIYLLWAWQENAEHRLKHIAIALAGIAIIPFLTSLPFILWSAQGFIKSILFSATRDPVAPASAFSFDVLMNWKGLPAKLTLLVIFGLAYLAAWRTRLPPFMAALLIMGVFVAFNSVLFMNYLVWIMAFIPLGAYELARLLQERQSDTVQPDLFDNSHTLS